MTVVILPDPTTRHCPKHRGELMTDSVKCLECVGDEMVEGMREATAGAFKDVKSS